MPLDPAALVARPALVARQSLVPRDVILYALGIGASELPFVYENGLKTLPSMALVMASPGFFWPDPDFDVDWRRILHGESHVQIHRPLPVGGKLTSHTTFGPIYDKGAAKGAVVYQNRELFGDDGELLATIRSGSFLRGDGGRGGTAEDQPPPYQTPDRTPDAVIDMPTTSTQALLYRLSGDLNPLHVDPEIAASAGFARPILHGLCSLGVVSRAVLAAACNNQPERVTSLGARFASPVFPGETIAVEIWRDSDRRASFRATIPARNVAVLTNGQMEFA